MAISIIKRYTIIIVLRYYGITVLQYYRGFLFIPRVFLYLLYLLLIPTTYTYYLNIMLRDIIPIISTIGGIMDGIGGYRRV